MQLGLFDIMQVDPLDARDHAAIYRERLEDLAFADELGFDLAFVAERHYLQHYRTPMPGAFLAAATQRTARLRLGVLAYTLPLHAPVRLAEEVAMLDQLSGGRIEVGVGLGHRKEELIANGIDPSVRIPMFQERLAVIEGLWSGAQVSIDSAFTTIKDIAINPPPVQTPHPPLWYAGVDTTAATWAGQHGMSMAIGFAPLRDLIPAAAGFAAGKRVRAEFDGDQIERPGAGRLALMQHVYIADTDEQAFSEMADDLERLAELQPDAGATSTEARKAAARKELERLIEQNIFLAGSPAAVANGIRFAQQSLGVDVYLANVYAAGVDRARVHRTMRHLATTVRTALAHEAQDVDGKLTADSNPRGAHDDA